ncbi:MAG: oligosaccharide flippase family protein [Spongiibacteraceae bacterium]
MESDTQKPGKAIKHSTIYAMGNLSRQIVSFIMLPVYTRFLTPADYGVVGLLTLSLSIIEPFLGARLGDAIPRFFYAEKTTQRQNAVVSTAFIVTFAISLATVLVLFALKSPISNTIFGTDKYSNEVGIFSILFLTQAIEYYGFTYIRIQQKPKLFIALSLAKMVSQITLNLLLIVFWKLGVMGMVVSNVVSSLIISMGLTAYAFKHVGFGFSQTLAKDLFKFSWPLWISGLATLYIYSSNRYLIRIFGSIDQVGLYELAARIAAVLGILVWSPFYQYWETEQFRIQHQPNAKSTFKTSFTLILIILAICTSGLSILSYPVIAIMASEQFHGAAFAVSFLTVGTLFANLATFASFGFFSAGATGWVSKINIGSAVLITALNAALIPSFGFYGAASALMITLAAQFLASNYFSKKFFDMEINIFPVLVIGGIIVATGSLAEFIPYQNFFVGLSLSAILIALTAAAIFVIALQTTSDKERLKTEIRAYMGTAQRAIQRVVSRNK